MKKGRQDTSSEARVGVGGDCDMVTWSLSVLVVVRCYIKLQNLMLKCIDDLPLSLSCPLVP